MLMEIQLDTGYGGVILRDVKTLSEQDQHSMGIPLPTCGQVIAVTSDFGRGVLESWTSTCRDMPLSDLCSCPKSSSGMVKNCPDTNHWLVFSTPLKNMKVTWDDYSHYMEK